MPHKVDNLYATRAEKPCSCGPKACLTEPVASTAHPIQRPFAIRALYCRSGSLLIMASSESVCPSRRLIFFVRRIFTLRPRMGWNRQIPQFALRICDAVPSSVTRRPCRVHLTVTTPTVIAFALSAQARQPQIHARRFSRGCVIPPGRDCEVRFMLRPGILLALHRQGRLRPSFRPMGHPIQTSVIAMRPNNQLPQPDLHRLDTQPYGLQAEATEGGRCS
jgi:hypothetical protein